MVSNLWFSFFWPGMGMFTESYILFAVGNVKSIYKEAYPDCWKKHSSCSEDLVETPTYTEVAGVMFGMLFFGVLASVLGRRVASISTATIMCIGAWLITASYGGSEHGTTIMYAVTVCIFGMGVGGEYPVSASIAAEKAADKLAKMEEEAGANAVTQEQARGQAVVLTFSQQGIGAWVNVLVIL